MKRAANAVIPNMDLCSKRGVIHGTCCPTSVDSCVASQLQIFMSFSAVEWQVLENTGGVSLGRVDSVRSPVHQAY